MLSNAGVVVLFLDPLSALLDHLCLDVNSNADVVPVLAAWLKAAFSPNRAHVTQAVIEARLRMEPIAGKALPITPTL